ncbi:hypothetical protein T4E_1161 [Trichinella pseudospiralis]|uniref:Uncharacterized protein n=1 Tax=Trichinella pseudospiralis TaxID=6337 RepID=A0A0V0XNM8_TRIPS|nr:hypothetical protein T4E_1161 [Trichinella pseudospiralis]
MARIERRKQKIRERYISCIYGKLRLMARRGGIVLSETEKLDQLVIYLWHLEFFTAFVGSRPTSIEDVSEMLQTLQRRDGIWSLNEQQPLSSKVRPGSQWRQVLSMCTLWPPGYRLSRGYSEVVRIWPGCSLRTGATVSCLKISSIKNGVDRGHGRCTQHWLTLCFDRPCCEQNLRFHSFAIFVDCIFFRIERREVNYVRQSDLNRVALTSVAIT